MKYLKLICGQVLTSFSISLVLKASLGVFPVSATNLAISHWIGISYGLANSLVEICMMLYAMYKGERVGWNTLLNGLVGGFLVDGFMFLLPTLPLTFRIIMAIIGLVLLPLGYATTGSCGLGEVGSCMFQTSLQKQFNKSTKFIRNCMEISFLIIGLLGARSSITWFSIVLSLGFGTVMSYMYKLVHYDPTEVVQNYIKIPKIKLTKRIH